MKKVLIIGLGTGRCGTVSLSALLNLQEGVNCTHESRPLLPWEVRRDFLLSKLDSVTKRVGKIVGDVGFYYLPYVRLIHELYMPVRFICLRRDKKSTVDSYIEKMGSRHVLLDNNDGYVWRVDTVWDRCYPKFHTQDRVKAFSNYWDLYYSEAEKLKDELYNFEIFDTEDLNSPEGVRRILEFALIDKPVIKTGIRMNTGKRIEVH